MLFVPDLFMLRFSPWHRVPTADMLQATPSETMLHCKHPKACAPPLEQRHRSFAIERKLCIFPAPLDSGAIFSAQP
ncbi:MAG TPA: hypothetical protein VFH12_11100 [Pseudoxanthomonas sp.]|nr:hypothetical protein [Pseudoxanthomonas sp.]